MQTWNLSNIHARDSRGKFQVCLKYKFYASCMLNSQSVLLLRIDISQRFAWLRADKKFGANE